MNNRLLHGLDDRVRDLLMDVVRDRAIYAIAANELCFSKARQAGEDKKNSWQDVVHWFPVSIVKLSKWLRIMHLPKIKCKLLLKFFAPRHKRNVSPTSKIKSFRYTQQKSQIRDGSKLEITISKTGDRNMSSFSATSTIHLADTHTATTPHDDVVQDVDA